MIVGSIGYFFTRPSPSASILPEIFHPIRAAGLIDPSGARRRIVDPAASARAREFGIGRRVLFGHLPWSACSSRAVRRGNRAILEEAHVKQGIV